MIYGIMGALHREIAKVKELMDIEKEAVYAGRKYVCGTIQGKRVVLAVSKIGKVAAAQTVTTMIQIFQCEKIIVVGLAGAVDPALEIGDFVVAEALVQHDIDLSDIGDPKYEVSGLGKTYFEVADADISWCAEAAEKYIAKTYRLDIDETLAKSVQMDKPTVYQGTIASGDQFIGNREIGKQLSAEIRNLKCLEMETAAAAQVCYENKVPILAVRIVSDKADDQADVDFMLFAEKVAGKMIKGFVACLFADA